MTESTILSNLNEEQKLPASTIDGAVLVTAGAGSGKTAAPCPQRRQRAAAQPLPEKCRCAG